MAQVARQCGVCAVTLWRQLKKWNIHKITRYKVNHESFSSYSPQSTYWAGLLASDGNVSDDNRITISLKVTDREHLRLFCNFLKTPIDRIKTIIGGCAKTKHAMVRMTSLQMSTDLHNLFEVVPRKSLCLLPPKQIPKQFLNHFVRGYMDGDGCISWDNKAKSAVVTFTSGSRVFLAWIKNVIKSHVPEARNPSVNKTKNSRAYSLRFGGKQAFYILGWVYQDCNGIALKRKQTRYKRFLVAYRHKMERSR